MVLVPSKFTEWEEVENNDDNILYDYLFMDSEGSLDTKRFSHGKSRTSWSYRTYDAKQKQYFPALLISSSAYGNMEKYHHLEDYYSWDRHGVIPWAKEHGYQFCTEEDRFHYKVSQSSYDVYYKVKIYKIDIMLWCNALSEMKGLEPVYRDKENFKVIRSPRALQDIRECIGENGYYILGFFTNDCERPAQLYNDSIACSYSSDYDYSYRWKYEWEFWLARNYEE